MRPLRRPAMQPSVRLRTLTVPLGCLDAGQSVHWPQNDLDKLDAKEYVKIVAAGPDGGGEPPFVRQGYNRRDANKGCGEPNDRGCHGPLYYAHGHPNGPLHWKPFGALARIEHPRAPRRVPSKLPAHGVGSIRAGVQWAR